MTRPPATGRPAAQMPGRRRGAAPGAGLLAATVLAAAVVAGCGASAPPLGASASALLSQQVAAVRSAAENHDVGRAQAALAQLSAQVSTLHDQGQISAGRAAQILAGVADVAARLGSVAPASTTTTTSTPPTTDQGGGKHGGGDHGKQGSD